MKIKSKWNEKDNEYDHQHSDKTYVFILSDKSLKTVTINPRITNQNTIQKGKPEYIPSSDNSVLWAKVTLEK